MSRAWSIFAASVFFACGSAPAQFRVGGRITHETLEGGFWSIRGDDGVTYDPLNLAAQYQKDGLPVLATLVLRPDMASVHMVGPIVDVVSIEIVPAFAGAWRGKKSYLTTDGQVMGFGDGWAFAMRMTGLDKLEFVNGPAAKITDNTSFVVSQYTYPPSYPPGPSSGTCAPVVDSILGGVGALERDGTLSLTLNWTHTCGGEASRSVTKYSMTWVPALSASEFPQL